MKERAASWPFPGLVWGDYPQQAPAAAGARPRARPLSPRRLRAFADAAAALPLQPLSALPARLQALRQSAPEGDAWLLEAFGSAGSALALTLGFAPHRQQLLAARVLLDNRLVEMATGEGKTAAIALAAAVAALAGTPVHVITANDYLAQRDAGRLRPFFALLGLRVDCVTQPMATDQRRLAYACDVTYCTAKEIAFDYLRDAMARTGDLSALEQRARRLQSVSPAAPPVLRGLCMAILDEADTVLIDEARMPLVLSQGSGSQPQEAFHRGALALARRLEEGRDFQRRGDRGIELTPAGLLRLPQWPVAGHPLYGHRAHRQSALELALTALHVLRRDHDYVVREGQVQLIDETTGRAAPGRAWSQGLHQMVELKEEVALTQSNSTVTQITFQRFFPRYLRLAGASGTLGEARAELKAVYGLQLVVVPPRTPPRVTRLPVRVFPDSNRLWQTVAATSAALQQQGRPVLVGTDSVAQSEALSRALTAHGLEHRVLNARQDEGESELIAAAGQCGRITVATSMAGRGSDILLDATAVKVGGLHVILCQHNASSRIDRQFLGRAGRQGQPGSSQAMLALDFPLLQRWWPRWWLGVVAALGCPLLLSVPMLRLAQAGESFTQRKQRVTLSRISAAQERDLTFSRQLSP
ncbi:DEAD/DEAH box helicase [Caenimonas terrae]|uniref:DEAD/DEAH box helicase n=1 Tax=Caenimonas terrae TaxID=696074 RepID=A0ABW0NKK9_9BURK